MRSSSSLLGRDLLGIALRLEILTKIFKIIFNQNLFSVFSVWSVDVFGVASQEILEEIFVKNGQRPEIIQFYYNL